MADPNVLLPLITAGGTILAAVITGFLAATLKHRWDVKAEELRWGRERRERRRGELKSAFSEYLTNRRRLEHAMNELGVASTLESNAAVRQANSDWYRSLTELQAVLVPKVLDEMQGEIAIFSDWLKEASEEIAAKTYSFKAAPAPIDVLALARVLLGD